MKFNTTYVPQAMQLLVIVCLYLLTLMPVEVRWADADLWLLKSVPVICIIGVGLLLAVQKSTNITRIDLAIVIWFAYYMLRVYVGNEYPCATDVLKTCTMALLYATLRMAFASTKLSAWWLVAAIVMCGAYESINGFFQMINGTSRHYLFPITGNFQNPGPYSAYVMMGSVVGLCSLQNTSNLELKKEVRKILLALTTIMLVVLPATWSRAAFVGLGMSALWIYKENYWKYRYLLWGTLCLFAIALYFIKQGSAEGRGVIWLSSLMSWSHAPWLGVGIGGFRHACAEGMTELWNSIPDSRIFDSAGVADYAYNSLLKILVEQGLVGAILCVIVAFLVMRKLYGHSKPLFMGVGSLLIFSIFSYPFELLPYCLIITVVAAWIQSYRSNDKCDVGHASIKKVFGTILTTCILVLSSIYLYKEICQRYERDKDCRLFSGMHNEVFLDDYYELFPSEQDNPQFLFDFAKALREDKRYRDSNAILRKGTLVSADPMFYVLQGNNYRDEGFYDSAENAYKKAFAVMPNRIYPLYQLMKLSQDTDDIAKSLEYATKIVQFKEKVSSPATKEIKEEAEDLLNHARN